MPIYEYQGKHYDIATDDPAAAKAKILGHLGTQETPAPSPAPLAPKPKQAAQSDDFDFGAPMGTGSEEIMAQPTTPKVPKFKSVLEGREPEYDEEALIKASRRKYVEQGIKEAERATAVGKQRLAIQQAGRDRLRKEAEAENYGILDYAADTGIDLAKGAVGLGENYVGLLDITSGGAAGKVLGRMGYDPERTTEWLNGFQSITRKNARQNVKEAEGFVDTLGALLVNPTELLGSIAESLPGTVASGAVGGKFVRFLAGKATAEASALGLTGKEAQDFISGKVKEQAYKIAAVAGGTEGAQTAGSVAEKGRQKDKDWDQYVAPAIAAGLGTAAISALSGKVAQKLGIGDIETSIAARSAGVKGVGQSEGTYFTKLFKEMGKEGLLEELPQGVQEQIFTNLATGRPWDEGIGKAAAQSIVTGAGMAGGHVTGAAALQKASSTLNNALFGLSKEEQQQQQEELKQTNEAPPPPPPATNEAPPAPPSPAAQAGQARADRIEKVTQVLVQQGIPAENAGRIAERRVDAELKGEAKAAAIKVPEGRVEQLTQDLIASGVDPQQAVIQAQKQAQEEAEADELAKTETGGAANVAGPISKPAGESTSLVGQSDTEPSTGRIAGAESDGMVSTRPDVAGATTGETGKPLTLEERLQEADERRSKAIAMAKNNLDTAEATKSEYGGLKEAFGAHRQNVIDTLSEQGETDRRVVDAALDAYDKEVEARLAKEEAPAAIEETPIETKGAELGTETTEAQQTTQERQAAPTAGAVTKGKRGRPPVQQRHVVVKNSEGKFEHVTDGEVTATYANNKQATAAVNLAKAKDANNTANIAKYQAELDKALASTGRGRPAKAATETKAGTEKLDKDTREELDALESALETYNSTTDDKKAGDAALYISDAAVDPTVPKAVRERAQQMLEDEIDPKDIPKKLRSSEGKVAKADTGFSNLTNGSQAIAHIIKTGNLFQRFVAERIRNFVVGVKFVVVEKGDPMPPQLRGARGLFVYTPGSKERTIYVRGASFGDMQGVNVITVLHELLHAATASRIEAGLLKGFRNASLQKFMREMEGLMKRTQEAYEEGVLFGDLPADVQEMIEGTTDLDPRTGKVTIGVFADPHEFLAYGMSSPEFQKFLMGVQGKRGTGFSGFVDSIRDLFGIKQGDATAFSDLVDITDKMLGTRLTATETKGGALQQKGKFTPPEFDVQADIRAKRSALELERDARKAKQNVANSREGDMATAVEAMQKERDPSKVRQILANAWSWMDYKQREAMVRLPTFDFLAKWAAEKGINALTETNLYLERMLGMSQQFLAGAEQVVGMLDRGFKEDKNLSRKAFEDFVYATTIAEIDPSDPNAVERSKTLDEDYRALGTVGQRMYKDLRNYYEGIIELYSDLLDDQIQNAQGLTQSDKNNLMAMLRKTFEAKTRIKPYFPLVRRGDFWLAIGSGADRRFYTFESRIDRNNKAAELAAHKGDDVEDMLFRQEFVQGNDLGSLRTASKDSSQMLKQTFDAIDKMEMGEDSAAAKESLKDAVYQIYLNTMPEQTFRKQFTHRKNRMGFSTDVRQNVATTAAKQATQLARLKYAPLLRNSVSAARDSIREQEELSPFVQEAEKRVNLALSGGNGSLGEAVAGAANKASFFWYLSGASSALIQPSSIFISGLPVLAGNYNNASGAGLELAKMVTLVNQYSLMRTNSDGSTSISAPSIANNKSLPADERQAVSEMVSRGVSQSTYASMVWGYKQTPTESMYFRLDKGFGNIPVAYGKGKRMASLLVGALMHNTERLSREAVYLAAYRLGKKQGLTYADAVQKAVDSTNEALGNYDITNKPRFMQQGIGKIAFQFKMYPLQMTLLMLTNLKKMMPFLNKEGKKEAATKFFGMMGTSALLGGVANMALFSPIMGLIGWAWSKMRDDEDWPEELKDLDFQTWFREVFLPEKLGDTMIGGVPVSELIDRGPLNALTGYDIASRIGLNDLWGRDSKETKTARDSAIAYMLDHFAGPTASLGLSLADAYDAYAMGDYQKMQEKLAPAAIRNLLVANRMADEGMKTGRGSELVGKDDVKTGELIGQAIGFRPDILAATQGPSFKLAGIEQRILNQRGLLLNKLDFQLRQDTDKGDERFEKILEDEVPKFNIKYPSYALDSDAIYNSLAKKAEQRLGARAGVIATEKNIPLIEEATDTMERRLDRRADEMKARREKNPR
jgi:hypothetical protein